MQALAISVASSSVRGSQDSSRGGAVTATRGEYIRGDLCGELALRGQTSA
jgi:hypothetical protein